MDSRSTENKIIGSLRGQVEEMAIRVRHLESDNRLTREEYGESTAKYLDTLSMLRRRNEELENLRNNLEALVHERTRQLEESLAALHEESTKKQRAEKELRESERKLLQAEKMKSIGTLAGGIAHDFNNLLTGIQGYVSIMLLGIDVGHPYRCKLKQIEEFIKSGAALTKQLLEFAREGKYEIKPIRINDTIKRTAFMFGRTNKDVSIHTRLPKEIWTVEVDPSQIEQVLMNLYVNAGQAMPKGGELTIESYNIILDENYTKPFYVKPGAYVKVSVTDTGIGMDDSVKERIFEPFFTTREMGRGVGLGLASAYGIIKSHGGIINVYSEKGHGTTLSFYLPASLKEAEQEAVQIPKFLRGRETLLLVDDELMILDVGREILEALGYQVITARNGRDAVDIYQTQKERIDLVILDMIMPCMGGGETFDRIRAIDPDAAVILSSGYSISGEALSIMERGCQAFAQKPYNIAELSQKIRDVLDRLPPRERDYDGGERREAQTGPVGFLSPPCSGALPIPGEDDLHPDGSIR